MSLVVGALIAPPPAASQLPTGKAPSILSKDGVLEFRANSLDGTVTVRDLLNKVTMSESLVCPDPRGAVLTRDEVSLLVVCRGSGELVYLNTAHFDVVARVPGLGPDAREVRLSEDGGLATVLGPTGSTLNKIAVEDRRIAPLEAASSSRQPVEPTKGRKNQLAFIGTIHGEHRTSKLFSLDVLHRLIVAIGPDYVLTEIPPNRLDRAKAEFTTTGRIAEPRTSRFPEYVDVLFPMLAASRFQIVGTSGWTQPMDRYRRNRLAAIARDKSRATDWAEYQAALKASEAALATGGALDDPRWIHTDAYDAAQRLQLDVYNRLFDQELGTGGWETINKAHFANMTRALDQHSGKGVRILVTYGAGHKSWMLPRLRERADLEVLDLSRFLDEIGAARPSSQ